MAPTKKANGKKAASPAKRGGKKAATSAAPQQHAAASSSAEHKKRGSKLSKELEHIAGAHIERNFKGSGILAEYVGSRRGKTADKHKHYYKFHVRLEGEGRSKSINATGPKKAAQMYVDEHKVRAGTVEVSGNNNVKELYPITQHHLVHKARRSKTSSGGGDGSGEHKFRGVNLRAVASEVDSEGKHLYAFNLKAIHRNGKEYDAGENSPVQQEIVAHNPSKAVAAFVKLFPRGFKPPAVMVSDENGNSEKYSQEYKTNKDGKSHSVYSLVGKKPRAKKAKE